MKKLLALCLLNLVSLALCSTTAVSDESRKTSVRSASASVGTSAHLNSLNSLNSLQSSQDNGGKQQSVQQSSTGHTSNTYRVPEYTSITQPHNAVYSQPTAPTGGYFISVNPQSVPQAALGPGPTPVIMQYLPHNAQQGPIQYLQLIPTRPLIVPISPYIPPNFNSQYSNSPTPQASSTSPYSLPHHSYSSSPQQTSSSYGNSAYGSGSYGSGSYGSGSYGSSYSPSLQNPIGGYSTNYLTYSIRPNHGMQLVNGPLDLSLNTNEYIPIQNENTYKMRRV